VKKTGICLSVQSLPLTRMLQKIVTLTLLFSYFKIWMMIVAVKTWTGTSHIQVRYIITRLSSPVQMLSHLTFAPHFSPRWHFCTENIWRFPLKFILCCDLCILEVPCCFFCIKSQLWGDNHFSFLFHAAATLECIAWVGDGSELLKWPGSEADHSCI